MNKILYNNNHDVRLIWRFISFILITALVKSFIELVIREYMEPNLLRGVLSRVSFVIATIFSLYIQIRFVDKSSFEKYGLKIQKDWNYEFLLGCFIALLQQSLYFGLMISTNNLKIEGFFITNSPDFTFFQGFVAETIRQLMVGIGEEILFRSFLIYIVYEAFYRGGVAKVKSALLSCVITSTFFGLAHFGNNGATIYSTINLSLDGMMICLPFLITGRLGLSIGMHFSWNLVQGTIFGLPNSGTVASASIFDSTLADNMFTGGTFGPEGSILLIAMDALAVVIILYWKKIKRIPNWVSPVLIKGAGSSKVGKE